MYRKIFANGQLILILHEDQQENSDCHSVTNRTGMITSYRNATHVFRVALSKLWSLLHIWLQKETLINRSKDISMMSYWLQVHIKLISLVNSSSVFLTESDISNHLKNMICIISLKSTCLAFTLIKNKNWILLSDKKE